MPDDYFKLLRRVLELREESCGTFGYYFMSLITWGNLQKLAKIGVLCLALCNPMTVAYQASLSMEEYWSGLPFPLPGDLPDSESKSTSLTSPALEMGSLPLSPPGKSLCSPELWTINVCVLHHPVFHMLL